MRTTTTQQAIAFIEAARAEASNGAIAFDGDGTLWSGDIGEDFFHALLAAKAVRPEACAALAREAQEAGLTGDGTGTELAERIHLAYLGHAFPEERCCEVMTWVSAGWSRADLGRFCADVLVQTRLAERLHGEAMAIVEHARKVGLEVYLVSASPRTVVEEAAKIVGITNIVAATEVVAEGIVAPAIEAPIPYGQGKVTRLRERIGTRPLHAAFGDNAFDVPMLREARHAFAVRPKARLRDRASDVPGLTELTT